MAERPFLEESAEPCLPDRRHVTMHGLGDEEAPVSLLGDPVNQPNRLFRQGDVDASVHGHGPPDRAPMVHIDDVYVKLLVNSPAGLRPKEGAARGDAMLGI